MFLQKNLRVLLVIALMLSLALMSGCTQEQQPEHENIYRIGDTTGDWGFPSPYKHYHRGPGYVRMSLIFDTLVWKDDAGYIPALAKEWEYAAEEKAYIFTLQREVTWHDGEPFDARDVVFTFNYVKEHPYVFVDSSLVDRVEMLDDYKVKLVLSKPYAPFLANVAATMPILPEHIYKDIKDPENFTGEKAAIGTGPYKFEDYKREMGTYLYTANENYYLNKPAFDKIMFIKVNEQMAASALQKNEVDAMEIKPEMQDVLKENFNIIQSSHDWNAKLMINHKKEPYLHKEFRQALAYAIDRKGLVQIINRGHALAGSPGIIPPDSPWFNPATEQYEYNPEKAGKLIESLGYVKNGDFYEKDGEKLTCELLTSERFARDAEYIKELLENAGIKVVLKGIEEKTLDVKVSEWDFDLALSGNGALGGDPEILNKIILGDQFISARYTQNETLVNLLNKHIVEMDEVKRKELIYQIQDIFAQELPVLTLYYPDWYYAFNEKAVLYYTPGGLGIGTPLPLNKMIFVTK